MHPLFNKADRLSGEVINAAIEVHRIMGPGLLESIYEYETAGRAAWALAELP